MSSTPTPTQIDPKDIPTLAPDVVLSPADLDVSKSGAAGKPTPSPPKLPASSAPKVTASAPKVAASAPMVTASPPKVTASAPMVAASTPKVTAPAPKVTASAPKVIASAPKVAASAPEVTASAPEVGATAAAGTAVPPVDATFRAASTNNVKGRGARTSFGRRLMRVVIGMILTACLAGAAVVWESQGEIVRPLVARWAPPFVLTLLSRMESPAVDPQPAPAAVADTTATAAPSTEAQAAADNVGSTAASPSPEQTQLLQSMARDLAELRLQMEQMKAGIADLKAGQDQMAREASKASEATNLRPRVSPAPAQQPIAFPARKPPPLLRPVQPRAGSVSPQAAVAYVPRQTEPRVVAPPPPPAAAPPTDLSAPRPPAPMREQMP